MKETDQGGAVQYVTLVDSDKLDGDMSAAVSEVWQTAQGIRFKFHDKLAALEKLGRHLGMFNNDDKGLQGNITLSFLGPNDPDPEL
jgi:hypothetical protein